MYKANFLWNAKPGSIDELGYEFANAKSEEYRKEVWDKIVNFKNKQISEQQDKSELDPYSPKDKWI